MSAITIKYIDKWDSNKEKTIEATPYADNLGNLTTIQRVTLVLGRACNMTCKHCSQNIAKDNSLSKEISPNIIEWLVRWCEANVNNRYRRDLMFWGGEPLLYLKQIKQIVSELESHGIRNVRYIITTNGKLFSEELLDYFYEHNFRIILSCDAPNPTVLRSEAPSDEVIRLFNSYKGNKVVNSIYCAKTSSLIDSYKFLMEKFPENTTYTVGYIRDGLGVDKAVVEFPDGKVEKDMTDLYRWSFENEANSCAKEFFLVRYRRMLVNNAVMDDWQEVPVPYCGAVIFHVSMDLDGNVYTCHNGRFVIGTIEDSLLELQKKMISIWKERVPEICKTCPIAYACGNVCTEFVRNDDGTCLKQCQHFKDLLLTAYKLCSEDKNEI